MGSTQEIFSEQRKLLKQYYQVYNPHSANDLPELHRIREQYNHLATELKGVKVPFGLLDPLVTLPPELLLQCFQTLIRDCPDGLLPLLAVSRRWRYFLSSAPRLWTRICMKNPKTDAHHVQTSLLLSQDAPLEIEVVIQPQWAPLWSDLFVGHSARIRELRFRHHSFYEGDYYLRDLLFRLGMRSLARLEPLPSLETLEYTSSRNTYPHLLTDGSDLPKMPNLRNLIGFRITSTALDRGVIHLQNLEHFSTESSIQSLAPYFSRCPRLEHLELYEPVEEMPIDIEAVKFPYLKTLAFDRRFLDAIFPILRTRGTNIVNLYLMLAWIDLADTRFLGDLPQLSNLRISCPLGSSLPAMVPVIFPSLPGIREFHFIQKSGRHDYSDKTSTARLSSLFKALTQSIRHTKTLNLVLFETVPVDALVSFLVALDQLEEFEFKYDLLDPGGAQKRTCLPSINHLRLCNEVFLRYVDLPSLSSLRMDTVALEEDASGSLLPTNGAGPISLYAGRFTSVQKLTWDGVIPHGSSGRCSTLTTAFTNLRELTFAQAYARKDSNDFCETLLRFPTSCSHLEKISFHCYPSWDLLLHMLLRRNFLPGSTVAPIRTIQLPGLPSSTLLTPIINLLSGRLTVIPRLSDIALTFRSGLFDHTIPGCDCCLDCGLSCTSEVATNDDEAKLPELEPSVLEQPTTNIDNTVHLQQYGDEENPLVEPLKAWFDSWPARRQVWNTYSEAWGQRYRRTFACGKHDFIHLVTISASPI